ncbi:MAG: CarD family transcriptional regulator [Proteobacteria bacterium]|jgi:CarD family transcriptional regulator|nr:CarD family transcriptional regulator [Pseudomonadota bacterium]
MFNLGDHVVCPGHGVGQILSIETKDMGDAQKSFYIIKVITNGMKVMIPVDSNESVRNLVSVDEITNVFSLLQDHNVKVDNSTWNRRHREYTLKVKTGSLLEIADVLRQLLLLKMSKKLSFGERKMLDQCKELLVKEIALSSGSPEPEISNKIDSLYS